jgi:hypothetical protein
MRCGGVRDGVPPPKKIDVRPPAACPCIIQAKQTTTQPITVHSM